ncbi:hypothetical protein Tco_0672522 [Tanacetum coccineum]
MCNEGHHSSLSVWNLLGNCEGSCNAAPGAELGWISHATNQKGERGSRYTGRVSTEYWRVWSLWRGHRWSGEVEFFSGLIVWCEELHTWHGERLARQGWSAWADGGTTHTTVYYFADRESTASVDSAVTSRAHGLSQWRGREDVGGEECWERRLSVLNVVNTCAMDAEWRFIQIPQGVNGEHNSEEWFHGLSWRRSVLRSDEDGSWDVKRIGPVAYRLRLPEELSGVHDTFHVSNLKKCLADASLHVPLGEIKVDKTLRFVEEPVEIMDREVKSLKRSKIALVKVRWNSKRGPEFTWEREDYMKSKYPQLFVDRADESAS